MKRIYIIKESIKHLQSKLGNISTERLLSKMHDDSLRLMTIGNNMNEKDNDYCKNVITINNILDYIQYLRLIIQNIQKGDYIYE